MSDIQMLGLRDMLCGMHVHVELPDPDGTGLRGGGRSADRTSLHAKFPDNREFNREFFKFGPFSAILVYNRQANSIACRKIPYATEQGIIVAEQGNWTSDQFFEPCARRIVLGHLITGDTRGEPSSSMASLRPWWSSCRCAPPPSASSADRWSQQQGRFRPGRRPGGARRSRRRVQPAQVLPRPSPAPSSPSRRPPAVGHCPPGVHRIRFPAPRSTALSARRVVACAHRAGRREPAPRLSALPG
jgi:hypothetical protein